MIGQKFNKLTVLEELPNRDKHGNRLYKCICECGNIKISRYSCLKRGNSKQCKNCAEKQRVTAVTKINIKENKRVYHIYKSMLYRCREDQLYGLKGIRVCDRWSEDETGFFNFLEDMGNPPSDLHSIDRINNNLGYYKENCRWASYSIQSHNQNKRNVEKTSEYTGVSKCNITGMWIGSVKHNYVRTKDIFFTELDAAIFYDNVSEKIYGDRPNGTERKEVVSARRKKGSVFFNNTIKKYTAKIMLKRKQITVGSFKTKEEAEIALDNFKKENNIEP